MSSRSLENTIREIMRGPITEQVVVETHFKMGDDVIYKGQEGEIVKIDEPQTGKYYTVELEDGSKVKAAANELKPEDEDEEEDEDEDEDEKDEKNESIEEKTLTPAEKKKREEIAKAIERENPRMPMDQKMAIATAQAKKVAEEEEVDELDKKTLDRFATRARFSSDAKRREAAKKAMDKAARKTQNEAVDKGEYDYEGDMAKTQLNTMMDAAKELSSMLKDDENMPEWVQSKITKAADYLDSARDYMKNRNMKPTAEAVEKGERKDKEFMVKFEKGGSVKLRSYMAKSPLDAESKAKVDAKRMGMNVSSVRLREQFELDEAVSVNKKNYSWGKMITVHQGRDTSYPLHPEHQAKIKSLKDDEKTSFKDETGRTVTAHRAGDTIHLSGPGTSKKTAVARSHFNESVGSVVGGGIGQFIGNKIDPLHGEIMRTHGAAAGRAAEYTIRKHLNNLHQALKKHLSSGSSQNEDVQQEAKSGNGGIPKKKEDQFHNKLDKLMHRTFGHSPDEKKMKEETELDELSRDTLGSYVSKASDARRNKNLPTAKVDKRMSGVAKASARLDKMDEEEKYYSIVHKSTNKVLSTHKSLDSAKDEHRGMDQGVRAHYYIATSTKAPKTFSMKEAVELYEARTRADIEKEIEHHRKQIEAISNSNPGNHPQATLQRRRMARPHVKKKEALEKELASMKEEVELDEGKYGGFRIGPKRPKYPYAPQGDQDPRTGLPLGFTNPKEKKPEDMKTKKEQVNDKDLPFEPSKKKPGGTVTDKSGAKHTPMSRTRHLARTAVQQMMKKKAMKETKAAPPGYHFTRDGKLKRGDADQDGDGGSMLRADPLDKQRSKIPPVSN